MKIKLFILTILTCSATIMLAQQSAMDTYFSDLYEDDRFTQVSVSSKMFGLFVNFEMDDPAEQELVETISKLKGLKVLAADSINNAAQMFRKLKSAPMANMDQLMSVQGADGNFEFFITESNGIISELVMIGNESHSLFILSLLGDIDLKQISQLSERMNINGFEHFKNVNK